MARIKNMGQATAKFNEGIIVDGTAASDTHTFIASGSSAFVNDNLPQLRLDCGKDPEFGQIFADFQVTPAGDLAITGSNPNANCTFLSNGHTTMIVQSNAGGDADPSLAFSVDSGATLKFSLGVDDSDADKFKIGTSTVDNNTRLTIDSAGQVGIGTTSPASPLHIYGNLGGTYVVTIDNDENNSGHGLKVTSDGSGTNTNLLDVESGSTTVFRVRADGKVAIGTTAGGGIPTQVEALTVDGDLSFKDYLKRRGDSDTYIGMPANDQMQLVVGGVNMVSMVEDGSQDMIVFNEGGGDVDLRIESDNDTHAFFVDSGNDKIGIGTASPAEKLEVNGNIKATDVYVNKIRRASDNSTTTKIKLESNAMEFYVGDSSNQICTVNAAGLKIDSGILETDILITKAVTVNVRDVNSTSSVQATDYILRCIQTANITITLPAKSGNAGRVLIFKDTMGNAGSPNNDTITLDGDSSDTIDGVTTYVIDRNGESITLICDGINGWMIASRVVP